MHTKLKSQKQVPALECVYTLFKYAFHKSFFGFVQLGNIWEIVKVLVYAEICCAMGVRSSGEKLFCKTDDGVVQLILIIITKLSVSLHICIQFVRVGPHKGVIIAICMIELL